MCLISDLFVDYSVPEAAHGRIAPFSPDLSKPSLHSKVASWRSEVADHLQNGDTGKVGAALSASLRA